MARMSPGELPNEIILNELRSSEVRVYKALKSMLDDSFVVFYSRPWLGLTWDGREVDGECDFVVAHPTRGMLTLEVKGGGIEYIPESDRWFSVDRYNCRHKIKNPVEQARKSKHILLGKLRKDKEWGGRFIRARHGVIFPDCQAPRHDLGADMPRKIFCFAEQFEYGLSEWVHARLSEVGSDSSRLKALGDDGVRILEKLLAKPFRLRTPLAPALRHDVMVQDYLTTQQFHILSALESHSRAAIAGAAGTGKTALAMEKARCCAEEGMSTLFLCYNRPLALYISEMLKDTPVHVTTFHQLCSWMAEEAGLAVPESVSSKKLLFSDIYPSLLVDAAEVLRDVRYDAIIVDEGQDFEAHWWVAVETVRSSPESSLYVFFDSNQKVYDSALSLPVEASLPPIRLTRNLRNTKTIHTTASAFYEGFGIQAEGPLGKEPEWLVVDRKRVPGTVSEKVTELIRHEKVPPSFIAVLAPDKASLDQVVEDGLGGYPFKEAYDQSRAPVLTADTIRRFKGLESPVVVLVLLGFVTEELAYVALSRARSHLTVVGPKGPLDYLRGFTKE